MSNPNKKHKLNAPGKWYCTDSEDDGGEGCIACAACYNGASEFFASDDDGNAYVQKQPSTAEETEACQEQMDACPVASIGNNG